LDILGTAAQVRDLQDRLATTETALHQQTILNHLQLELSVKAQDQPQQQATSFTVQSILQQEKKIPGLFLYYTNLKYATFCTLLEFLTSEQIPEYAKKRRDIKTMTKEAQLLLTLMRLRHNFGIKDLASRFCISTQCVSDVFCAWIELMYVVLGSVPLWPNRNDIINNMPAEFKAQFPTTLAIIDCAEMKTQKPSSLKLQSQMYSDYKSATTLKGLVACDPLGNIVFDWIYVRCCHYRAKWVLHPPSSTDGHWYHFRRGLHYGRQRFYDIKTA
jgi:hypothetical protein